MRAASDGSNWSSRPGSSGSGSGILSIERTGPRSERTATRRPERVTLPRAGRGTPPAFALAHDGVIMHR